ncbi:MAG TPA: hypothetical protein VL326_34500 [Kofleriaceae bacterium]|jgi:hypothetical protein|nr:hypothetical protein [Kofleriaceae bacterium]
MRMWILVVLAAFGCEGKKNAEKGGSAAGSQVAVAVAPGDAVAAPVADAAVVVDAAAAVDARVLSDPKTLDYEHLLDWETVGPLKLGMSGTTVIKLLGQPKKQSFPVEEGATGQFVSDWEWPQGIVLGMAGDKRSGPFVVRSIEVFAPSTYGTSRGVVIGTPLGELPKLYMRNIDEGRDDPKEYLVGSVYGGMLFTLKDDKVVSIFLGAMAF